VTPIPNEDREVYQTEYKRRRRVLIRTINSLVEDGKLTCPSPLTDRACGHVFTQPALG
jgi:hypothetical protein